MCLGENEQDWQAGPQEQHIWCGPPGQEPCFMVVVVFKLLKTDEQTSEMGMC